MSASLKLSQDRDRALAARLWACTVIHQQLEESLDAAMEAIEAGDERALLAAVVKAEGVARIESPAPGVAVAPATSQREQFEEALRRKPEALGWNLTDAMFWAWCAARNAGVSASDDQTGAA